MQETCTLLLACARLDWFLVPRSGRLRWSLWFESDRRFRSPGSKRHRYSVSRGHTLCTSCLTWCHVFRPDKQLLGHLFRAKGTMKGLLMWEYAQWLSSLKGETDNRGWWPWPEHWTRLHCHSQSACRAQRQNCLFLRQKPLYYRVCCALKDKYRKRKVCTYPWHETARAYHCAATEWNTGVTQ